MNTDVKRYLRDLKRCLPYEGAPKKRLMDSFKASLSAFLEETPEPDMLTLHKAFGSPNEMANVLATTLTEEEMKLSRNAKLLKRVLTAFSMVIGVGLLTLVIYVLVSTFRPIEVTVIEQIFVGEPEDYPYDIDYPLG